MFSLGQCCQKPIRYVWLTDIVLSKIKTTINVWRTRCESPTTNIGEHALRNKNLNVLGSRQQILVAGKESAMDSKEFEGFSRNLEV